MTQIKQLSPKEGVTLLAVKVPEGADAWKNESYHINTLWYKTDDMRYPKHIDLPEGNWQLLGIATEIPEEVWQGIMPVRNWPEGGKQYKGFSEWYFNAKTAAMPFLEANEVYSVNPVMPPDDLHSYDQDKSWSEAYEQAEANTGTWVILKREG